MLRAILRLLGLAPRASGPEPEHEAAFPFTGRVDPPAPRTDDFWAAIAPAAQVQGAEARNAALAAALSPLDEDALQAFYADFDRTLTRAYRSDLWAAAYAAMGGCSDDGFEYFRCWLISEGRETFEAVLADPSRLIAPLRALPEGEEPENEGFAYVVLDVHEARFGTMPMMNLDMPEAPEGPDWDEDAADEMYPELADWGRNR